MKRILLVLALVATGTVVAVTPASASETGGWLCITNQTTWLRNERWGTVIRTLGAGRGFRVHEISGGSERADWYYGHGAEAPSQDGWIPATNCNF